MADIGKMIMQKKTSTTIKFIEQLNSIDFQHKEIDTDDFHYIVIYDKYNDFGSYRFQTFYVDKAKPDEWYYLNDIFEPKKEHTLDYIIEHFMEDEINLGYNLDTNGYGSGSFDSFEEAFERELNL